MRRRSVRVRGGRIRRLVLSATVLAVALGLAGPATTGTASAAPGDDDVLRVLLFYKSGYHASHVQARQAVNALAAELATEHDLELQVQETEDPAAFTTENLATVDTLVFAQTGGVLFNTAQRAALESYIRGGGGFAGLHYTGWSVGQSEHDVNPFYLKLIGAMSEGHPENPGVRSGRVVRTATGHPLTQGLPADITRNDEWYDWTVNPAANVRTLLEADETSYQDLGRLGSTHPITWCQQIDSGRSWYTGMGHEGSAYSEPFMRAQMKLGIAYAAGLVAADCSPPVKDEAGSWSGVTPWPLMPINMALTPDGKVQSFGSVGGWGSDTTPFDWTGDSSITQGGQMEFDIWDPAVPRTLANYRSGLSPNQTYTDLFCSMQVQNPHTRSTFTVGGDDSMGGNSPNDAAIGVTSYKTGTGMRDEAPMNYPRWYPTGTTTADGDIVVQGGSLRGGPGGPGVLTPEIYTPDSGNGWKLLTGATSALAYGDGGNGNGADENRWWYPRAFVAPGSGTIFNISGTRMFDLDPSGNGQIIDRGALGAVANQGGLGNPVGATSTAAMYRPGKILQVGGGWWANGGGPAGARAGFTVDITGGTANPVVTATQPMKYQRHWATATMLPDGDVMISGGSRENNGNGGYVTNIEIWNPDTGQWRTVEAPHEHARLYHSSALLLPDGRVMIGGGGAPGPRNYTDVEYYSPSYLFDGNDPAVRPVITSAPKKVGYNGSFQIGASGAVSRVTLVRNGSVTHGFNNDQNFQDLAFTQSGGNVTITSPQDGTYAPPGSYMLFVFDADGTPSVAKIIDIDPAVKMDQRSPKVVDQFEYPKLPTEWRGNNPPTTIDLAPGNGRMAPWSVESQVQLVRGTAANQGGLGGTGYQLALGTAGSIERTLQGLDAGREYRVSLRYARDSRAAAGLGDAVAQLSVGDLDATLTATTATPSSGAGGATYATYVGTFTAGQRSEVLSLTGSGAGAGLMIDDLVVIGSDPGVSDVPIHFEFEEGAGTTTSNTGTDATVAPATLVGTTGWSPNGTFGNALDLKGGSNANTVDLPDNLLQGEASFTTSFWVRPDTKGNWINLLHIGDGMGDGTGASFFQIQMQTQAAGNTGLAATFKAKGTSGGGSQERVYATAPTRDVTAGQWNHVAFTRQGSTGTLYLNGQPIATKNNFTITMAGVGSTTNNWIGRNGFPDPSFDGLFDDLRMYRSALSATDIAGLYADGSSLRTTTSVAVSPASPSPFGEPLSVTATVTGSNAAAANGNVELWVDDSRVGTEVALANGTATFPAVTLNRGDHEVEVRYLAAAGWRDSSSSVSHTVLRPPPAAGVPVHYDFDEGTGGTAANSGTDASIGNATLNSGWWTTNGTFGSGAVNLPGGAAGTGNHITLPNNIDQDLEDEFSVSVWANPRALPNWVPLLQIGSSTDTFFLLQSSTNNGTTGFGATFKAPGNADQQRLVLGGGGAAANDELPLNQWTHVVFTMSGTTGRIYFDGELVGTRSDFSLGIDDVGVGGNTTANMLGGTSWGDPRFNGLVDDLRLYGHELSPEEVTDLYEGPPPSSVPVGADDRYPAVQDEPLTVTAPGVLGNDTDSDTAASGLTAVDVTQPSHGEVTLDANGAFTYTPDDGFSGVDTFTYRASDGTNQSPATTVRIVVTPPASVTAPPVRYALGEGAGATAANSGYDTTIGSGQLLGSTGWADDPARGTVLNLPGGASTTNSHVALPDNIERDIEEDFSVSIWANPRALPNWVPLVQIGSSTDTFFLLQSSTQAGPAGNAASGFAATFKAPGTPGSAQERLTLGNGGAAANDELPLNEWTHVVFTKSGSTGRIYFDGELVGTRTDFTLGLEDVGVGGNTTANMIGGTSWPDPRYNGLVDDFRLYGHALSQAEVTELFTGPPVNNAPTAAADGYDTGQGEPLTVAAPGVLGNDSDSDDDELTATSATQPAHGEVSLDADGSFTYTPDAGFFGTDSFTYRANDGTESSDPATVTITVVEAEVAPEAANDRYRTDQDEDLVVAASGVLGNDTDANEDVLTAVAATQPAHGEVVLGTDGSFTYEPDAGFYGTDTFTYRASDGTSESAPATVTVVVVPPAAADVPPIHYTLDEGEGETAENTGYDLSTGDAELLGETGWTEDGELGGAIDLPGGAAVTENHVSLPNNIDRDLGDEFSISIWANPRELPTWVPLLQIGSSTDTFFLLQSNTQAGPENTPSGFAATFKAPGTPGNAQERLTLEGGDLPLDEWTHVVFTMNGTTGRIYFDGELMAERDDFTLGIDDIGVDGRTVANMIGGTSWNDPRFDGLVDDFRIYGHELTEEEVLEVFEGPEDPGGPGPGGPGGPVNAVPLAGSDAYATEEGQALTVAAPGVLANDTDADGQALAATAVTQPGNGAVALSANGAFTYTPAAGFHGTDTFTYRATDGVAQSATATVTITVAEEAEEPPVETTVAGSAAAVVYGDPGVVTATVSPATATGSVSVSLGSQVLGAGTLAGGSVSITLPARALEPGRHDLTLRYAGDREHEASMSTVTLTVRRATPTIEVKAPAEVDQGKKPTVRVTIDAPSRVPVTGTVTVKVRGGDEYTGTLRNGKVKIRLPKADEPGKLKLDITYSGSDLLTKVEAAHTITVLR